MDAERRRHYLQAMGIPVWVRRQPPAVDEGGRCDAALQPSATAATSVREPSVPVGESRAGPPVSAPTTRGQQAGVAGAPALPSREGGVDIGIAELDWEDLRARVATCTACSLHATRTHPVFGVGDPQAKWMVIGEAPGADEDRQGEPFVGRAGQLLNAMLLAIGLRREQVYIANLLKSRPPKNRDPLPEETAACEPYLRRQIALVGPQIILIVGRIAAQHLLRTELPIGRLRGRVHTLPGTDIPLVVTYHPAYLLRSPGEKRRAWDDLRLARGVLDRSR
jgi:uracil-DNA glycosylase